MSDKKTGIVKYAVSRTGGVQFEGDNQWYNAIKPAKELVTEDLKGCRVEMTLGEKPFTFVYITKVGGEGIVTPLMSAPSVNHLPTNSNPANSFNGNGERREAMKKYGLLNKANAAPLQFNSSPEDFDKALDNYFKLLKRLDDYFQDTTHEVVR